MPWLVTTPTATGRKKKKKRKKLGQERCHAVNNSVEMVRHRGRCGTKLAQAIHHLLCCFSLQTHSFLVLSMEILQPSPPFLIFNMYSLCMKECLLCHGNLNGFVWSWLCTSMCVCTGMYTLTRADTYFLWKACLHGQIPSSSFCLNSSKHTAHIWGRDEVEFEK